MAYDIYKDPNIVQELGGGKFKRKDGKIVNKYGLEETATGNSSLTPKPKFNLFDFQTKVPGTNANKVIPTTTAIATKVEPKRNIFTPSSPASMVKPVAPTTPTTGIPGIPTASANEKDLIQTYFDDKTQDVENKKTFVQMLKDGVPSTEIEDILVNKIKYKPIQPKEENVAKKGFLDRLGESASKRFEQAGKQQVTGIEGGLQFGGALGGFVGDLAGNILTSAYETAGEPGKEMAQGLLKTEVGQKAVKALGEGVESYNQFKSENPRTANALENIVNITNLIPATILGKQAVKQTGKVVDKVGEGLENVKINKATKNISKGEDILYEAVNPTTRENKAVLKQRVQDLMPYIDKNPLKNSLEDVKARIDVVKTKAGKAMEEYETNIGVKGKVNTDIIIKALKDKYQEKIGTSFINPDEAKISKQLIDTLKGFGKEVTDSDIIKIRRAWDKIIEKNKGFMQSAESNSKGDIFADANKYFREEIKKSNPEYAKYLTDYHKSTTLGDVIEATIQRRVGQQKGGFIKRGLDIGARISGAGLGGLPGYVASEALIQGANLLASPGFKLTRGAKLLQKGQKVLEGKKLKSNNVKNGLDNNGNSAINNNMVGGKIITPPTSNKGKTILKPKKYETIKENLKSNNSAKTNQVYYNKKGEPVIRNILGQEVPAPNPKKAGLLGGSKAYEPKDGIDKAKLMEKSGVDPDVIWEKTGWEKGTDGKWRFEIDDSKAKLKDGLDLDYKKTKEYLLKDVLEHDDLFKQYPNLKEIKIIDDPKYDGRGEFTPGIESDNFFRNPSIKLNIIKMLDDGDSPKSTLLHEIQHYIQSKEGFATGGSPRGISSIESKINIQDKAKIELDKLTNSKEFKKLGDNLDTGKITYKQFSDDPLNKKYERLLEDSMIDENIVYKRLAGETEARNVQTRLLQDKIYTGQDRIDKNNQLNAITRGKWNKEWDGYTLDVNKISPKDLGLFTNDVIISKSKKYFTIMDKNNSGNIFASGEDLLGAIHKYNNKYKNKLLRPAKTEDVARDKQIIKMEGGKAMSVSNVKKVISPKNLQLAKTGVPIKTKVYHGTEKVFNEFDNKFLGSNTGNTPTNKAGFSFTDNKEVAKTFGRNIKEKEVILNNPLVIDAKGQDYGQFKHILNEKIEYAQKKGYDGIVVKNYKDAGLLSKGDYIQSNHIIEFPKSDVKKAVSPSDGLIKFEGLDYFKKGDKYYKRFTGILGENKGKIIEKEVVNPGTIKELEVFKQKGMKGVEELRNKQLQDFKQRRIDRTKEKELFNNKTSKKLDIKDLTITKTKLPKYTLYHGTSSVNLPKILKEGFKAGNELPENAFRGGGHGAIQNSISFSLNPKISANFTGTGNKGGLITVNVNKDANIVKIPQVEGEYAEYLNDIIPDLKKKGIDAIYIGGEDELVVINKNIIKITGSREFNVGKTNQELKDIFEQANKKLLK